jgi:tripartite-type tricarboxylate transporter receptor subunit TctC
LKTEAIMDRRTFLLTTFSLAAIAAHTVSMQHAVASDYPNRQVRILAAIPPGSANDVIARVLAQRLSEKSGRQFIVENMPGAGGTIGTGAAARAVADGYTLLIMNQDFVIQPLVKSSVPYDPFKSFEPIALAAIAPEVIVVNPSVPAKTVKELLELVKANPGKYSYASPGHGTSPHLASERLFRLTNGADVVHVPFQGGAPAVTSTIGGHTQILHITLPLVAAHLKEGTLRPLAVASIKRVPMLPEIPTLAEAGIPNHEVGFWTGLVAPAGTPRDIIDYLNKQIEQVLAIPEVKDRLATIGFEPAYTGSDGFAKHIQAESAAWASVVRNARIRVD